MTSPTQRTLLLSIVGLLAIASSHAQDVSLRGHGRRLQEQPMSDQLPSSPDYGQQQQQQQQQQLQEGAPQGQPEQQIEPQAEQQLVEDDQIIEQSPPQVPTQEEMEAKQMRAYLGGLFPAVDINMCPLYLRDTTDMSSGFTMDLYSGGGTPVLRNRDITFFWHIPRSGGATLKNIMNYCYDLRRAEQLEKAPSMSYARNNVLNMDTTTPDGLAQSYENQIASSNLVDVIASNYFLSGSALFNEGHYGKSFTMLRHPVELATSLFYQRRKFIAAWSKLTFHDYVSSENYLDSWMTRQLTGTMPWVPLDETHLEQAKLVLKNKIFVGVLVEMDETLRQLKAHFGWEEKVPDCEQSHLQVNASANEHPPPPARGGPTWKVIIEKEKWDMALYYYGLELFAEQRNRYPPQNQVDESQSAEALDQVF